MGLTTAGQVNCSDSQIADIGTTSGIPAATVDNLCVVSASVASSNAVDVWLNGAKGLSTTYAGALNSYGGSSAPVIGAEFSTAGPTYYEEFAGYFLSAWYFGAAFNDGQHAEFHRNPYQFLIPA
jgi:hypothetical protein